jgi:hypothetical protein
MGPCFRQILLHYLSIFSASTSSIAAGIAYANLPIVGKQTKLPLKMGVNLKLGINQLYAKTNLKETYPIYESHWWWYLGPLNIGDTPRNI